MHTDRPAHPRHLVIRPRRLAAGAGAIAALAGVGLGAVALVGGPEPDNQPAQAARNTLQHITVTPSSLPLSAPEILALLGRDPDFGTLDDPRRRASCLAGLGYPMSTRVLGARPVTLAGRPAVLLVLPGERPDTVIALGVPPSCSSVDTGLLADTTVRRP